MNTPNPAQVASARTARLVREAATPVYSTDTVSAAAKERTRRILWADEYAVEDYCLVCGRATDHRGEHSDEQLLDFYAHKGKMFRR